MCIVAIGISWSKLPRNFSPFTGDDELVETHNLKPKTTKTATWNAKCPIFLGNFTPKTSNYCLANRALGFPGRFYWYLIARWFKPWPFDPLVGGHDSPLNGSRFHHPKKVTLNHQEYIIWSWNKFPKDPYPSRICRRFDGPNPIPTIGLQGKSRNLRIYLDP